MRSQKKTGLKKSISWIILMAVLLVSPSLLSGCKGVELENKTEQVRGYSRQQAMILLANERNRYQNVYSPEIWQGDFQDQMVENVKGFLEQIATLKLMAEERGINLTGQEQETLRNLSDQYYAGLSEADRDYIGCSLQDVQTMYTDYYLADKVAETLTQGAETEISDSEAKIIHVDQIVTASLPKAMAILKLVKLEGSDFDAMARRYSESEELERELYRAPEEDVYQRTAFSLDEGEISNIVEMDGMYYIIRCRDGYDEEATLERKERLQTAMLDQAFLSVYQPYQEEHRLHFTAGFWNQLDFSDHPDSTVTNFFSLYQEYFS